MENSDHFATWTKEEADEAAATLLAELDSDNLTNKKKKKEKEKKKTTSSCSCKIEERQSRRIATGK